MTKEKAKDLLRELMCDDEYDEAIDMAIEALDAEPVHGEWLHEELIPNTVEGHVHGECSVCHAVRVVDNYCPNCGAKME